LYPRAPHYFLLLSTSIGKLYLLFLIKSILIGGIETELSGVKTLAEHFKVDVTIASSSESMEKEVELAVIDVEVVVKEESSE